MYMSIIPLISATYRVARNESSNAEQLGLTRFDTSRYEPNAVGKCSFIPIGVIHNFQKVIVYVYYSYEVRDEENRLQTGSWGILSKWDIERHNGRWIVTCITEDP